MSPNPSSPMVLLLHDSELQEARDLLGDLGVSFVERIGSPTDVDKKTAWDVVIASEKRVRSFDPNESSLKTLRIAIIDNDSRTLRSLLKRLGVNFVVARPVHALALRLLFLHALYRGPERRKQTRVSVGAPVQVRAGFRKREALLADLSLRGAQLISDSSFKEEAKLKIFISAEISGGKAFSLPGRVLRSGKAPSDPSENVIAVRFDGLSPSIGQHLRRTYESFTSGPARLSRRPGQGSNEESSSSVGERRTAPRYDYNRRIVALDDEAAHVLVGRDISIGGMRVEPNETLVPGDNLKIAIHLGAPAEPLVVLAQVMRDEGAQGLVLTFRDVDDESRCNLEKMVEHLEKTNAVGGGDSNSDFVMSEIVERRTG